MSAGELSPAMHANADMVRYQQGLKKLRNAIVLRTGGVQNRPGTEYCGTTKNNGAARLIPAVFDTTESYVLEFGNLYMRVWEDGALVTVGTPSAWVTATAYVVGDIRVNSGTNYYCLVAHTSGTFATDLAAGKWYALTTDIFEIPTPYTTAQLFDIQFAAQYRVLTLVHPSHPPRQLTKGMTDIAWILTAIDFQSVGGVTAPENVVVDQTPAAPDGIGYAVTAVLSDGTESAVSNFAQSDVVASGGAFSAEAALTATPITVSWDTTAGAASYNIYRKPNDSSNYGFLLNTPSTSYTDNGFITIVAYDIVTPGTTPLSSDLFGSANNYPSVVGAYQQRLLLAGTNTLPDYVYASQVAAPENFNVSDPIVDSDAMEWRQVGRRLNRIRHFAEVAQRLVQFSDVGESIIQGDTDGILRPGEVNPRQFSENGSAKIPPLVLNDSALYVQARGAIVRDISPIEANGFAGSDLTLMAAHLVDGYQLVDWCYEQTPNSVVWAVRDDGTLLSLTYVRELGILGWATHDTDGEFESIACIPESTRDAVYAVVQRTINATTVRLVERFASRTDPVIFMDCAVTAEVEE